MTQANLLNHLWQSTIFAALVGLLALALRKNRAPVRYWLWFAASCKFLVPFSLLMMIGSRLAWRAAPQPLSSAPLTVMNQISEPFAPATPAPLSAHKPPAPIDGSTILLCVWLCGFSAVVFAWARQWWRVRAALRSAAPLALNVPIRAVSSSARIEPGVFGIFRPVLLMPEGITDRLTAVQWQAILAHELCHLRRRDNLTAAIHMAIEAIFWFHPLVWWIGKRLVDERERACDEEVLLAAADPAAYAEGILNVCKFYLESPLRCVSGVTGSNLKKRIRAIMTERVAGDLNFAKKIGLAIAGTAALAVPIGVGMMNAPRLRAQSAAAATPKFEVAAIRACTETPGGRRGGGNVSGDRLTVKCIPVESLIQQAYVTYANGISRNANSVPISGGPAWIKSDLYEIEAKAENNVSREMVLGPMMQTLLEDRFKLEIHRETREIPVYALTVAKGGFKLHPIEEGSCTPFDPQKSRRVPGQKPICGTVDILGKAPSLLTLQAQGLSLDGLPNALRMLDRPVIDRTGIKGRFTFHLDFARDEATPGLRGSPTPDGAPPPAAASDPASPSIFTAIQEQLGLKLEPTKGPGEFLVIDHVERPSEN